MQDITIHISNGIVKKVSGGSLEEDSLSKSYHARFVIINGIKYDLHNPYDLVSLPFSKYEVDNVSNGPRQLFDYVLRMIASNIRKEISHPLSNICLLKATSFMYKSTMGWTPRDYLRIREWLVEDFWFDEADFITSFMKEKGMLNTVSENSEIYRNKQIDIAISNGIDLIKVADVTNGSELENIEGDRVYSISGKNPIFPKYTPIPKECRNSIYPIFFMSKFETIQYIALTKRPRVDTRSEKEKQFHQDVTDKLKGHDDVWKDTVTYYKLKSIYGDIMPKTVYRYFNMKNANNSKYQELLTQIDFNRIDEYPRNQKRFNEFVKLTKFMFK